MTWKSMRMTWAFKDVTWTQVGGVISSHCGPTAFGAVLTLKALKAAGERSSA